MDEKWYEGVVTSVMSSRVFITFKHGSTICRTDRQKGLSLGHVVDICVEPTKDEECFNIVKMGDERRKRNDLIVEEYQYSKCSVYCNAEVVDQNRNFFLLDTPVIGLAFFSLRDAPHEMEVGDVWKVKMWRRKEKKNFPSHWMAVEVVGDVPRVSTAFSRRERNTVSYTSTSGYSSRESPPYSPCISQDVEWTTVIITGSDRSLWYGSCAQSDCVRIPKNLNESGKNLERGAFHRVKCTGGRGGATTAFLLDSGPFYPQHFQVDTQSNQIKVWCYSKIVGTQRSDFVVHNELIGHATLPQQISNREMRVGDKLDTLYCRDRTNDHRTHWMVEKAHLDRPIGCVEDGEKFERKEDIQENESGGNECSPVAVQDRRVLDKMKMFANIPGVRAAFLNGDNKSLEEIDRILERDRSS